MRHRETSSKQRGATLQLVPLLYPVPTTASQVVGKNSMVAGKGEDGKDALTTPEGTLLPFARFAGGGETEPIVCGFERILVLESRRRGREA